MMAGRWIVAVLAGAGVFALVLVASSQFVQRLEVWGLIGLIAGALVTGWVARARSLAQWALAALSCWSRLVLSVGAALVMLLLNGLR